MNSRLKLITGPSKNRIFCIRGPIGSRFLVSFSELNNLRDEAGLVEFGDSWWTVQCWMQKAVRNRIRNITSEFTHQFDSWMMFSWCLKSFIYDFWWLLNLFCDWLKRNIRYGCNCWISGFKWFFKLICCCLLK